MSNQATMANRPEGANEQQAPRPLRLGILVNAFELAAWAAKLLKDIEAFDLAEIVLLIKIASDRRKRVERGSFLYRMYRRLDDKLFETEPDAFKMVNLRSTLFAYPVLEVEPRCGGHFATLEDTDLHEIERYGLDIALNFSSYSLDSRTAAIAKYGTWFYRLSDSYDDRDGAAGFWEVMKADPVMGTTLVARTQDSDAPCVLYRSYTATDKRSVRRNNNKVAWKMPSFVLRKMRQLHEVRESTPLGEYATEHMEPCFDRSYGPPDDVTMVKLLAKHGWRYLSDQLHYSFYIDQWILYYRISKSASDNLGDFNPILPPKDRHYADPFCVERDGRYFIFLEEDIRDLGKGVLSVIEMDAAGRYSKPQVVLEKDYHLSYPFIFFYGGEPYLVPESADNRTVELYRCTSWPLEWKLVDVMLHDVEAFDATIDEIDDTYWMFVTIPSEAGGAGSDELYLFYADRPFGPWTPHHNNPVKSDVRSARSAGRLFRNNGRLYRPAQDCSRRYGYAISINEVQRITRSEYQEREVYRVLPNRDRNILATHTLNRAGGLTAIDARIARPRFVDGTQSGEPWNPNVHLDGAAIS